MQTGIPGENYLYLQTLPAPAPAASQLPRRTVCFKQREGWFYKARPCDKICELPRVIVRRRQRS